MNRSTIADSSLEFSVPTLKRKEISHRLINVLNVYDAVNILFATYCEFCKGDHV